MLSDVGVAVIGEVFGPYRFERLIGSGGMGDVYRAFDVRRDRVVALKRLPRHFADDPEFKARFRRESRLVARLREPHVIPIHDFGEIDGQLFIDMRLVDGVDLAELLRRRGRLDPAVAVDVVEQVASALDAAHEAGVVHRDVKPSNVLVSGTDRRPNIYLVDFGIAQSAGGTRATSRTNTGTTVGTLDYMAPERFLSGRGDHRVDVYSLACLLYEALTGERPFTGEGMPAVIYAHLHLDPPRASAVAPGVPPSMDGVVARGMAKDPEQRYETAGALAVAAGAALNHAPGRGLSAPPETAPCRPSNPRAFAKTETPVLPPQANSPVAQRRAWAWLLYGAAAAVVGGMFMLLVNLPSVGSESGSLAPGTSAPRTTATGPPTMPISGPMDVWLVGNPDGTATAARLPADFARLLDRQEITPVVAAISAADFPQAFADAAARGAAPEIVGGQNYLPFEALAAQTGQLVTAFGPIEALVDFNGFVFLPTAADRHAAAVELATIDNRCPPGGSSNLRSTPDPAADQVAVDAASALLAGDGPGLGALLAANSIQHVGGSTPGDVRNVLVCHHAGNEATGLVYLSATYSSDAAAGQLYLASVLVREAGMWKILLVSYDPVLVNLAAATPGRSPLEDSTQTALLLRAIDSVETATSPSPHIDISLREPADGQPPVVPSGEEFGSFVWLTDGDNSQVLAEFGEFAFRGGTRLVPAVHAGSTSSVSGGQLWTAPGEVLPWRGWALLRNGKIVISETRSFVQ
jgi:serine/threonine-protein kinase